MDINNKIKTNHTHNFFLVCGCVGAPSAMEQFGGQRSRHSVCGEKVGDGGTRTGCGYSCNIVHSNIATYYVEGRWGDSDVVIHVTSTLADADWEVKEI